MASLFIDTTYDITLGILDDDLGWIDFQRFFGQKASNVLQNEAYNMLHAHQLKGMDLKQVFTISGPGFYTGLRLSEGFADVTSFFNIPHYSFLSYDIPKLTGVSEGVWITKAYRGEYFFHYWNYKEERNVLVSAKELENELNRVDKSHLYIHSESAIDDLIKNHSGNWLTTHDLLKDQSQDIFRHILKSKNKVESFYFRAPEDEFKVST